MSSSVLQSSIKIEPRAHSDSATARIRHSGACTDKELENPSAPGATFKRVVEVVKFAETASTGNADWDHGELRRLVFDLVQTMLCQDGLLQQGLPEPAPAGKKRKSGGWGRGVFMRRRKEIK